MQVGTNEPAFYALGEGANYLSSVCFNWLSKVQVKDSLQALLLEIFFN